MRICACPSPFPITHSSLNLYLNVSAEAKTSYLLSLKTASSLTPEAEIKKPLSSCKVEIVLAVKATLATRKKVAPN
jgi:hypothetical protein